MISLTLLLLTAATPEVRIDRDVELFSLIFRLAGAPEYNHVTSRSPYATRAAEAFAAHKDHPAVLRAKELRTQRGIAFDAVMSLAVHAREDLSRRPAWLERRWTAEDARAFVKLARAFQTETGFDAFFDKHQPLYAKTLAGFKAIAKRHADLAWFNEFFGGEPKGKTTVILGMLAGSMNYGVRNSTGLTPVLGMYRWGEDGVPEPAPQFLSLLIHETAHSYVNPIVDKHFASFEKSAMRLFFANADGFRKQAYATPKIMMYESLVRGVVLYHLGAHGHRNKRLAQQISDQQNGFTWSAELETLFGMYELKRSRFPKFEEFVPALVAAHKNAAAKRPALPTLVKRTPAGEVDPGTTELRFTFSEPMRRKAWSMLLDGKHPFPSITGKIRFDEVGTTLIVPVRLEPGTTYRFWLNGAERYTFASAKGMPLAPAHHVLITGPAAE